MVALNEQPACDYAQLVRSTLDHCINAAKQIIVTEGVTESTFQPSVLASCVREVFTAKRFEDQLAICADLEDKYSSEAADRRWTSWSTSQAIEIANLYMNRTQQ